MTWLITGGAGYIGAHVVAETQKSGRNVVILDDLSTGLESRVPDSATLVNIAITDQKAVRKLFADHEIHGVLHLAARKQVGESIERPDYYWSENVHGLQVLLDAMSEANVRKLVFSSSAAVYGQPEITGDAMITETTTCKPINPYGATKLVGEWYAQAKTVSDGMSVAALRYFNVAGAGRPEFGDVFTFNLVPLIFDAITHDRAPRIYGDNYPTPDGTCIRDYIHVQDLAEAHVAAMDLVDSRDASFEAINIGTGRGSSVREVIDMVIDVTGLTITPEIIERRIGDPAALVADVSKARATLDWTSRYDLHDIVDSAWKAWQLKG